MVLDAKTGRSTDPVKDTLITPILSQVIENSIDPAEELSVIDLGSGDGTANHTLLTALQQSGYKIRDIAFMDRDLKTRPSPLETALFKPVSDETNQTVLETGDRDLTQAFLDQAEQRYNLAVAQLVTHQIESDAELSFLHYIVYKSLRDQGDFLVLNLHPDYLLYLAENEPNKFMTSARTKDRTIGRYSFDSLGSSAVFSRNIETQAAQLFGLGFELVGSCHLTCEPIQDLKPRYKKLTEMGIPMFYLLHLRKDMRNFRADLSGIVSSISSNEDKNIEVTFTDNETYILPMIDGWETIKEGDLFIAQQVHVPQIGKESLNYWNITPDNKISGGNFLFTVQKG